MLCNKNYFLNCRCFNIKQIVFLKNDFLEKDVQSGNVILISEYLLGLFCSQHLPKGIHIPFSKKTIGEFYLIIYLITWHYYFMLIVNIY